MERRESKPRLEGECKNDKKYSEIYGVPIIYRIGVTKYDIDKNGKRRMVLGKKLEPHEGCK